MHHNLKQNKMASIKQLEKSKLYQLLVDNDFSVDLSKQDGTIYAETSRHTSKCIEMLGWFEFTEEAFIEMINNFDEDDEVLNLYNDERFRHMFTLRDALDQMAEYEALLNKIKEEL